MEDPHFEDGLEEEPHFVHCGFMRPVLSTSGERMGDQEQWGVPVPQQAHVATKEESRWRTGKQAAATKSSQGLSSSAGSGKVLRVCLVMAIVDMW